MKTREPDHRAGRGVVRCASRRGLTGVAAADRGSVTAELAAAFPVVVLLLLAGLTGLAAVSAKLRCVDAAGVAARAAARGEPGESAARRAAPDGAVISVRVEGDSVRAVVRARVRPPVPLLPSFTVEEQAVAAVEPGGGAP